MKKKIIILTSFILLIILTIFFVIYLEKKYINNNLAVENFKEKNNLENILNNNSLGDANLDSFLIYGTHLNISGNVQITDITKEILDVKISFVNNNFEETLYTTTYNLDSNILNFNTSEYINSGIYLDDISVDKYKILLKIGYTDNTVSYYNFLNSDNFENLDYYTISKNGKTNLLKFEYLDSYIKLNIQNIDTPEQIYDICIDAGHGGNDSGATSNGYKESNITLDYAISLKESLEKNGFKVILTRSDNTRVQNYGKNGRATLPNEVKSKYTFSIHLNSSDLKNSKNGVEIYSPNKCDLSFAKSIADNIVKFTNTNYSNNLINKVDDGIYVRTFTEEEIEESKIDAKKAGYDIYENLTTSTPYLFMIRETGGKSTSAYFDGRNKIYEPNAYWNSNIGNESYLLELGFINSDKDLNNLLTNKGAYIEAITKSIVSKIVLVNE